MHYPAWLGWANLCLGIQALIHHLPVLGCGSQHQTKSGASASLLGRVSYTPITLHRTLSNSTTLRSFPFPTPIWFRCTTLPAAKSAPTTYVPSADPPCHESTRAYQDIETQLAMGILGALFGGIYTATRGGGSKAAKATTPPINASSPDEADFIKCVIGPRHCSEYSARWGFVWLTHSPPAGNSSMKRTKERRLSNRAPDATIPI